MKDWDPTHLEDNMSGIDCRGSEDGGNGDLADGHVYVGPGSPASSTTRATVLLIKDKQHPAWTQV